MRHTNEAGRKKGNQAPVNIGTIKVLMEHDVLVFDGKATENNGC